jgi:hypothetical protein
VNLNVHRTNRHTEARSISEFVSMADYPLQSPACGCQRADDSLVLVFCGIFWVVEKLNMSMSMTSLSAWITAGLFSLWSVQCCAQFQLITGAEAALPDAPARITTRASLVRGPRIEMASPSGEQAISETGKFHVKFSPRGGPKVDPKSVRVTYVKSTSIDLTSRVAPYLSEAGIDIPDAQLAGGKHLLKIEVRDLEDRKSEAFVELNVVPTKK